MNLILWVVQAVLAAVFLAHGAMFLVPPPDIAVMMNASLPRWFQVGLGIAEIAAAVGLILPGVTHIMPWLITWAAIGIVVVMVSATGYHAVRGEISSAVTTAVLLVLAAYVAHARWHNYAIAPRRAGRAAMMA